MFVDPNLRPRSRRKGLLSALGHLTVGASAEPAFDWGQVRCVLFLSGFGFAELGI